MRVAVMQPYFFPYAGYYRLLARCDRFLILDTVQFPRRGRVNRCEVPGPSGATEWLTLPLARQPRDVGIADLAFAPDAGVEMARRMARFPWLVAGTSPAAVALRQVLRIGCPPPGVLDYLETQFRLVAALLGFGPEILRASALDIAPGLRGHDRIIALVLAAGGKTYLNAPGGHALYDAQSFARAGLTLEFLPSWQGDRSSILPRLLSDDLPSLRAAILEQSHTEPA